MSSPPPGEMRVEASGLGDECQVHHSSATVLPAQVPGPPAQTHTFASGSVEFLAQGSASPWGHLIKVYWLDRCINSLAKKALMSLRKDFFSVNRVRVCSLVKVLFFFYTFFSHFRPLEGNSVPTSSF